MERAKRSKLSREGWRPVQGGNVWINSSGEQLHPDSNKITTPRNVVTSYGRIKMAKVVLWLFAGVTPRSGKITHLNGDNTDNSLNNIKYTSLFECGDVEVADRDKLTTAIRCYFSIDHKAKPKAGDNYIKTLLDSIVEVRNFTNRRAKEPYISIFADWLGCNHHQPRNAVEVAEIHGLPIRDTRTIIAHHLNNLTSEVCEDLNAGLLELQPYIETKRERYKRITQMLHAHGVKRPHSKSPQKEWRDLVTEIQSMPTDHPEN